jgi:hypothetical protein
VWLDQRKKRPVKPGFFQGYAKAANKSENLLSFALKWRKSARQSRNAVQLRLNGIFFL